LWCSYLDALAAYRARSQYIDAPAPPLGLGDGRQRNLSARIARLLRLEQKSSFSDPIILAIPFGTRASSSQ
jgi:hypothetical protein